MKRGVFLLLISVLLLLCGCSFEKATIKEPVRFYYQRSSFAYHTEESVIHPETREAAGHTEDLSYLLSNYLIGPTEEGLVSPFPYRTKLISLQQTDTDIRIELSDTVHSMTDAQFSLACACISLTCMELTGAESVTVVSGNQTLSTTREQLLLFDESTIGYGNDLQNEIQ